MVYRRFRVVLIGRVLLLSATIFLLFYLLMQTAYYAAAFLVTLFIVYQITSLVQYVEKTNRDLTRFLDAIKYSDFSQTFVLSGLGSSFSELKEAFNDVIRKFQDARSEKEEHFRYLQTVVQHVGIGLLAYDRNGDVSLINTAARKLLDVPYLRNIEALKDFNERFVDILGDMTAGQRELLKVFQDGKELQIMIYATEFRMQQTRYRLVSLQNIGSELEEKEMEAWQKLIRVLTHEIMNSITPISSLAATTGEMVDDVLDSDADDDDSLQDIRSALSTIHNRSQGLLTFVDAYRNLTRIPKPTFKIFSVSDLFEDLRRLMQQKITDQNIQLIIEVEPESLELTADRELIEQVTINLMLNAIQAVSNGKGKCIRLQSRLDEKGRVLVQVSDDGPGMSKEVQEKIFIPFFTTRKSGSGIGLSLAKQIMRLHNGSISVDSTPAEQTVFTLRF